MLALARDKGKESYQVFRMNKISRKQDMFTARHSGTQAHEHQASALWKAQRHGFGIIGMGGASTYCRTRLVAQNFRPFFSRPSHFLIPMMDLNRESEKLPQYDWWEAHHSIWGFISPWWVERWLRGFITAWGMLPTIFSKMNTVQDHREWMWLWRWRAPPPQQLRTTLAGWPFWHSN